MLITFTDLTRTFETADRKILVKALEEIEITNSVINVVSMLSKPEENK